MRDKKSLWKEILHQLLNLCLITILSIVIATVAAIPIYGILGIGQTNEVNLVYAILGILAEAVLVCCLAYRSFYNRGGASLGETYLSFGIAYAVRIVLSAVIHFYPFVAGYGVTYLGVYMYHAGLEKGAPTAELADIPLSYFIFPVILQVLPTLPMIFAAYRLAKRKRRKERESIVQVHE